MAVEFVTTSGASNATSYVTVAEFKQYWENRGVDYSAKTDAEVQVQLNIATQYIDNLHAWEGFKNTTTQALEFPRDWLVDRNNIDLSGTIPDALKSAVCEAAGYSMEGNVLEDVVNNLESKRMGPVSVTFGAGGERAPKLVKVEKYLGDFVAKTQVIR